MHHSEYMKIV